MRVTLSDEPNVLLTATVLNSTVQDADLAAKVGIYSNGVGFWPAPFFFGQSDMHYWLMKSEPDEASIDDLAGAPAQTLPWTGVRNYQARNFMRDQMKVGDGVLFYHSSCAVPGIAGIARVASTPYPDPTQFDSASPYYDPKAREEEPRWMLVDVSFVRKTALVTLPMLRGEPRLAEMRVLAKGNRLSITPVTADEWRVITKDLAAG